MSASFVCIWKPPQDLSLVIPSTPCSSLHSSADVPVHSPSNLIPALHFANCYYVLDCLLTLARAWWPPASIDLLLCSCAVSCLALHPHAMCLCLLSQQFIPESHFSDVLVDALFSLQDSDLHAHQALTRLFRVLEWILGALHRPAHYTLHH